MSFWQVTQHHVRENQDILTTIARVLCYVLCLFASLQIAATMGDTYLSNLGVFTIMSACLELLWSAASIRPKIVRLLYILCVFAIGAIATVLLWNVHHLHG